MTHTTVRCFWLKSYWLSCMRSMVSSLSSSKAMFLLTERVGQSTFWNETPAFISPDLLPPNTWLFTHKNREKCSSGSSKFMTSMNRSSTCSMSGMLLSKESSMTQLVSGANVSMCEFVWKKDLSSTYFNCNNAYVVFYSLFLNFMNIKQVLLC